MLKSNKNLILLLLFFVIIAGCAINDNPDCTRPKQQDGFDYLFMEAENTELSIPLLEGKSTEDDTKYIFTPHNEVKYSFKVESADTFQIWDRYICPSGSQDSYILTLDDRKSVGWNNITHDTTFRWDYLHPSSRDTVRYYLEKGEHEIRIRHREYGAKLDMLLITNDLTYTPEQIPGEMEARNKNKQFYWFEAESSCEKPFYVGNHPGASGGKYIHIPDPPPATYCFEIDKEGDYKLMTRILARDGNKDSFIFQIDSAGRKTWNNMKHSQAWIWDSMDSEEGELILFELEPGRHTLSVFPREPGTKLDRILLTNNLGYQGPEDSGTKTLE